METPFENYTENIKEVKKFFDFTYNLDPAKKLIDLIRCFKKVSKHWNKHHEEIKNDSEEWRDFNQLFNQFTRKEITNAENYLSIGANRLYDYTEVVGKQLLVMLISILETYLTQKFEVLLSERSLLYLNNLSQEKDKEVSELQLEMLSKFNFDPLKIAKFLFNKGRVKSNFQNFELITKNFGRLGVALEPNPSLEFFIDLRHLIVHRNGLLDKKFCKKHKIDIDSGAISVGESSIREAIEDIDKFVKKVEKLSNDYKPTTKM